MRSSLLLRALNDPSCATGWSLAEWDLALRQARRAGLLPRLAERLRAAGVGAPEAAQRHLDVATVLAGVQRDEVRREVTLLAQLLAPLQVPLVLMKGAAYVLAGLPPARARLFGDIDLLMPRERLAEVEACLMANGWATTHTDAYDQRYYREWMHELPPMVHIQRRTVLDLHHNILPMTAHVRPDAAALLSAALPLPGDDSLRRLSAPDLVLHSLCHLFHNDEHRHALRDLSDVDELLRHFGATQPGFWSTLPARAERLGLGRTLHDGLRYTQQVFGTPVPAAVIHACARWARGRLSQACMDRLWRRALAPRHASCDAAASRVALWLLYVRAHWLKMPTRRLLPHLAVKALRRQRRPAAGA